MVLSLAPRTHTSTNPYKVEKSATTSIHIQSTPSISIVDRGTTTSSIHIDLPLARWRQTAPNNKQSERFVLCQCPAVRVSAERAQSSSFCTYLVVQTSMSSRVAIFANSLVQVLVLDSVYSSSTNYSYCTNGTAVVSKLVVVLLFVCPHHFNPISQVSQSIL
jgi:hypothetical protein